MDEYEDSEDWDDSDDLLGDEEPQDGGKGRISDADLAMAGSMDGESDAVNGMPLYGSYGSSIDLEELSDEQRDLYDGAYYSGHDAGSDLEEDY